MDVDGMEIRDADPGDIEALARLSDLSPIAIERMIHERTVRVWAASADDSDPAAFVSFDATSRAVEITRLVGDTRAYTRLLQEVIRFAEDTGLPVETVVPDTDAGLTAALRDAGFTAVTPGPRFDGTATTRFRRDPTEAD